MILSTLKESTREQHEALESVVDVMNSTFTLDDYRRLITKFYRFYAAIEPRLPLSGLKANGFDAAARLKLPALERDLTSLGILEKTRPQGVFAGVPDVSSLPAAFGCCYVLEGATLGGQIISRHLKQTLGIDAESGAAFFSSYGPNVGPMWKEFGAAITAYAEAADSDDEIVAGAKATFDSFQRCFEEENREEIRASDVISAPAAVIASV